MGFGLTVEADWCREVLSNVHPDGKGTGGNAVFAFLGGLSLYCDWDIEKDQHRTNLLSVYEAFRQIDQAVTETLCETVQPLLDCMWGDGGDSTVYHEDEYEFFIHRSSGSGLTITLEEFQAMVRSYDKYWQPIESVIRGVQILLKIFRQISPEPLEGFYLPEETIPDFEALLINLNLLAERGNQKVRLNFR
ncbi:MAG TPA: hypothetical protein VHL11_11345 [Phototrophicaceae bacterium]|jgi:hypothetical protein|nr:hypothetical protein [Phototrophicaceae bacterium]